jgi:protein SCO1/2
MNTTKLPETTVTQENESTSRRVILRSPVAHRFQSKRFQSRRKPLAHRIRHRFSMCLMVAVLCSCEFSGAAPSDTLQPEQLAGLKFRQNLNAIIPLDQSFLDESGHSILLRKCLHERPAILVLGYYECPMLCNLVLNGLLNGLNDLKRTAGKDFDLIFVSINPNETPQLASAKRASYLRHYDRPGSESGWHFLTGAAAATQQLAEAAGFPFAYEPASKQYAHPAGVLVLTSEGKISKYLFGVTYPASDLNDALAAASKKQIGNPIQDLLMLCFHYNPITGKYGAAIMTIVRISGALTVAGLAWVVIRAARKKQTTETTRPSGLPTENTPQFPAA